MKRFTSIFLLLFIFLSACSENQHSHEQAKTAKKRSKPTKQIAWRDLSYTKDTLKVGEARTWNFVFYNTGVEPVRIKQALSSNPDCACQIPAQPVPVGEQDTVKLSCTFTRPGRETANITVEHDTPQGFPILILITNVIE